MPKITDFAKRLIAGKGANLDYIIAAIVVGVILIALASS